MTRPRPPAGPGPSIAGAVDLSALKQRPTPSGESGQGSAAPPGVEVTEANFEAEVLQIVSKKCSETLPAGLTEKILAALRSDGGTQVTF